MMDPALRVLVTAGPTHEPIDAVRYLANRSSGRMGLALADAAIAASATPTLLLGPVAIEPRPRQFVIERFQSTADLESALQRHMPLHDCLFMAAAVADHRPASIARGKLRRETGDRTLQLVPTPDLLAAVAAQRRPGQYLVGFALESKDELELSAISKLARKRVDAIVANELSTMNSPDISGRVYLADGSVLEPACGQPMPKEAFARWLMDELLPRALRRRAEA